VSNHRIRSGTEGFYGLLRIMTLRRQRVFEIRED
jgi:hypothetical protein